MSKKKSPIAAAPAADNQTQPSPVAAPEPRKRVATPIQPELQVEIDKCKKRISSIKALNKLTPVIEGMDHDALDMVEKLVSARRQVLGEPA